MSELGLPFDAEPPGSALTTCLRAETSPPGTMRARTELACFQTRYDRGGHHVQPPRRRQEAGGPETALRPTIAQKRHQGKGLQKPEELYTKELDPTVARDSMRNHRGLRFPWVSVRRLLSRGHRASVMELCSPPVKTVTMGMA